MNYSPSHPVFENNDLTILICAKNEFENLKNLIPTLLQQSIELKILIVDDFSTDDTASFLTACANENPQLKFITATKNVIGKKQALMDGLTQVKTKYVLLTDADCIPASDQWAKNMLTATAAKDIVLGYSPYKKSIGFLNRWIRYEAVLTAIQYFSYCLAGKTYMGVGRNLLYLKSAVKSGDVLLNAMDLSSGDDDLLVNSIAKGENVGIQLDPLSWVYSKPKENWSSYINQKRRHMTTASQYQTNQQILLLIFSISWILLYLSIVLLFLKGFFLYGIILLLLRWISTFSSVRRLFSKLDLKDCIFHWWYLDLFTAFYFLFFSIFVLLPKKETW